MSEQLGRQPDHPEQSALFAKYQSTRASLKPVECDDGERCWVREGPPARSCNNCIGCGGKIKGPPRSANGKSLIFDGHRYPSRKALARHLAKLTGRSPTACNSLLQRHGDDGAGVFAHISRQARR